MVHRLGVVMNGVTAGWGTASTCCGRSWPSAHRAGSNSPTVRGPAEPLLVGRSEDKLREIAQRHDLQHWTTDLDAALADDDYPLYFDAQVTSARETSILQAIAAGRHVYTEKPTAESVEGALELARAAARAGVKNGVVHDKMFLPGLRKLKRLVDSGVAHLQAWFYLAFLPQSSMARYSR